MANTAHLDFDYNGNTFLIKNELVNWIETTGGLRIGDIETGGSVATSAFHFAYLMGGDPIFLIGQDLAYTYKTSHSTSTSHFYRISGKTNRLRPVQSVFLEIMSARKMMKTPDNLNSPEGIDTDFVLNNFRGWFEESAKNVKHFVPDIQLINLTGNGARINNFTTGEPEEWLKKLSRNHSKIDKKKIYSTQLIDSHKVDKIISQVLVMGGFVRSLPGDQSLFKNIENSEWTFLKRYFMKEQVLFERYGKLDRNQIERKLERLIKNIEGMNHGPRQAH
jgi:hypothetical protein